MSFTTLSYRVPLLLLCLSLSHLVRTHDRENLIDLKGNRFVDHHHFRVEFSIGASHFEEENNKLVDFVIFEFWNLIAVRLPALYHQNNSIDQPNRYIYTFIVLHWGSAQSGEKEKHNSSFGEKNWSMAKCYGNLVVGDQQPLSDQTILFSMSAVFHGDWQRYLFNRIVDEDLFFMLFF